MTRRLVTILTVAIASLGLMMGPAAAHFNEAADRAVGPPEQAQPQGHGHAGMECGALNPNTPLVPLGLPCPADGS